MGFIDRFKKATGAGSDKKKEESIDKKAMKGVAKAGIALFHVLKGLMMLIISLWKFIAIALVIALVIVGFDFVIELVTAQTTPDQIYSLAGVEDVKELVEIKQNDDGEYYLDWVEDIDEKLENIIGYMNNNAGVHNLPDSTEFLKKILKAEIITQFPDLGGEVPEGSDGFQGAVDIKRVSPNKEIGAVENKGAGETYSLEGEIDDGDVQEGDYEEIVKQWQSGKKLIIKTTATVYEQTESELNPGSDTGDWQPVYNATTSSNLKIEEGEEVEYLGTYKNNTNPLTETVTTYVEVKYGDTQGFVKAQYLIDPDTNTSTDTAEASITRTSQTVTSRARGDNQKTVANENEEYTIAIAAGRNSITDTGGRYEDLKEEELTIKVAEKVENLLEEYSNINVVQTGSTESTDVEKTERTQLAKDADPDLCVQIYFNVGDGSKTETGVEVIYKDDDSISQQLAEILAETISSAMSLENRGAKTESSLNAKYSIIESAATTYFPSVIAKGGFLDGDYDYLKTNEAIDDYAQGIVDGVVEYLEADHSGYQSTEIISNVATESIESRIKNLKYVTSETMDSYINSSENSEKQKALDVFTIDEEGNIVTATWTYSRTSDAETIEITKNSRTINLSTSLEKYMVPYEYLLMFYIDTNEVDFVDALADEILKTEIILALEDNVTTVRTVNTVQQKTNIEGLNPGEWTNKAGGTTEVITENCSTSVGFTYIDCWFVKTYRDNSYSEAVLNMGNEEEIVVNISGQVTETSTQTFSGESLVETGTIATGERDENNNEIVRDFERYERTITTTRTIKNEYSSGDITTEGKEELFVKLYQEYDMQNWVREYYLFTILENNERTKNQLYELTKYLVYKATGINYQVVEFDFSIFALEEFKTLDSSGGLELLIEYIHYFEHNSPPPTNADGTKYIIEDDGAGNAVVGYGVDIFNGGFADAFRAAGYSTEIGAEVDIDFVDALEKQEIEECIEYVRSKTAGLNLKEYQIYALVSRAYNCGKAGAIVIKRGSPAMDFVSSYNAYWSESDDQYEERNNNANFSHSLYTQYMSKPVTGNGTYMAGLETRRKSEWTLFQTGYFDVLGKWYEEGSSGDILAVADELHAAQQTWTYSTGGDLFWNNIEMSINNPNKVTCCATYVSSVLYKAGYFTESEMNSFNYNLADGVATFLKNNGWQVITSYDDLQPGDVVYMPSHVQIYAGDGLWYNAGSTNAIQRASPYSQGSYARQRFQYGLRAPN